MRHFLSRTLLQGRDDAGKAGLCQLGSSALSVLLKTALNHLLNRE
jgi:hypothetical protein